MHLITALDPGCYVFCRMHKPQYKRIGRMEHVWWPLFLQSEDWIINYYKSKKRKSSFINYS